MTVFEFADLAKADLYVDALYKGGRKGNAGDDPFPRLLQVSNQGGFRYRGSLDALQLVVLTSSLSDPDWPDRMDLETGVFTYYGDNKKPGRVLHDTPRNGNELLRRVFELAGGSPESRKMVPPILLFGNSGEWRDVRFIGLAVPGTADIRATEDLVAVWKAADGRRFQNYRARFTVLDTAVVSRVWLADIIDGKWDSPHAPRAWRKWSEGGQPKALAAGRTIEHRTRAEQLPTSQNGIAVLQAIVAHFAGRPHRFEAFAASVARMLLPDITALDLTRPSRDGGRDGVGRFRVGRGAASIDVEFALEAKCYSFGNGVGVKEMSRLLSRLRHRQFGVLVTSSYLDSQAYREIKEDGHPIIVIAGRDVVEILHANGRADAASVLQWLNQDFPVAEGT